jgi:hypothetical protein
MLRAEAAAKLDAMNDSSGDTAAYEPARAEHLRTEREHAISDAAAIRALRTSTDQADTDTGSEA